MKFCPQCGRDYHDALLRFCSRDGARLSSLLEEIVGKTLDRYRVDRLAGQGGMGAVFQAYDSIFNRPVALKVILPESASNKNVVRLFGVEGKAAAQLNSEHSVAVHISGQAVFTDSRGQAHNISYIVMEWLDGVTIETELKRNGRFSVERVARLLSGIVAALEEAHDKGIVHRDLKPSNVMLVKKPGEGEKVKVLDFGGAKILTQIAGSPASIIVGTPHYASPEQLTSGNPQKNITGRADIYALGVMLFEMLAGFPPFDASSIGELVRLHQEAPPPPLPAGIPGVTLALEQLIHQMLAKDPDHRPFPASEVLKRFQWALRQTSPDEPLPAVMMNSFEFETVTLNAKGELVKRWKWRANSFTKYVADLGIELVKVPGGSFPRKVLSTSAEPRFQQVLVSPFCIGKYCVTQAQWRAVAGLPQVNTVLDLAPSVFDGADLPVENISWHEAVEFCERLARKTGLPYRLPSEAEWEYACRAGTTTPFSFGPTVTTDIVNCDGSFPFASEPIGVNREMPVAVGSLGVANAFGLFDMHGNVWEWCQDWYSDYPEEAAENPMGPAAGQKKVLRGGSWFDIAKFCSSDYRSSHSPSIRKPNIGFRPVISDDVLKSL